jgi:hypothetical protein
LVNKDVDELAREDCLGNAVIPQGKKVMIGTEKPVFNDRGFMM